MNLVHPFFNHHFYTSIYSLVYHASSLWVDLAEKFSGRLYHFFIYPLRGAFEQNWKFIHLREWSKSFVLKNKFTFASFTLSYFSFFYMFWNNVGASALLCVFSQIFVVVAVFIVNSLSSLLFLLYLCQNWLFLYDFFSN